MTAPPMTQCARCGSTVGGFITSMFNVDTLCYACKNAERGHPDYAAAVAAENAAVRGGDYNFPGVGWPGLDGRLAPPQPDTIQQWFDDEFDKPLHGRPEDQS